MNHSSEAAAKEISQLSLQPEDHPNPKQVVILVVANSRDHTLGLVDCLKSLKSDGDWSQHDTVAGVRIHSHDCGSLVIVDTIPLRHMRGGSRYSYDIARRWISRNGLRRIVFGKNVVVVCAVDSRVVNTRKRIFSIGREGWMGTFGLIFKPLRKAVIILAKTEAEDLELLVERPRYLEENVIYFANDQDGQEQLGRLLKESVFRASEIPNPSLVPHPMSPTVDTLPREMKFIWGPERVILVGRSGSGKSTLAQMLTLGKLDPLNELFVTSADIQGETMFCAGGAGRGWYVLDTPGFGESEAGKVSSKDAERRLHRYVRMVEGTFAHYLYVVKKGRIDNLDQIIWKGLMQLFGDEVKQNFTVVISGATDKWIDQEREHLQRSFDGCESFLSAWFPPDEEGREEIHPILQDRRNKSLAKLEEQLADRRLTEKEFSYGKVSAEHIRTEKRRVAADLSLEDRPSVKFRYRATIYHQVLERVTMRSLARLSELLEMDGRVVFPTL